MKLKRTFDPILVNSIVRHPDVFPLIRDDSITEPEELDCTSIVANSNNVALSIIDENDQLVGVFIFIALTSTTYDVHTNLLSNCRGKKAVEAGGLARDFMFTSTPCSRLVTRVPEFNTSALDFAKKNGFEVDFVRENSFVVNTQKMNQTYLSLDIYTWMRIVASKFLSIGKRFHDQLEQLKSKTSLGGPAHDDDEAHDVAVGISIGMMISGQIEKAEYYFNEWGSLAGYAPAKHLGIDNGKHIIDINEAVISLSNDLKVEGV